MRGRCRRQPTDEVSINCGESRIHCERGVRLTANDMQTPLQSALRLTASPRGEAKGAGEAFALDQHNFCVQRPLSRLRRQLPLRRGANGGAGSYRVRLPPLCKGRWIGRLRPSRWGCRFKFVRKAHTIGYQLTLRFLLLPPVGPSAKHPSAPVVRETQRFPPLLRYRDTATYV